MKEDTNMNDEENKKLWLEFQFEFAWDDDSVILYSFSITGDEPPEDKYNPKILQQFVDQMEDTYGIHDWYGEFEISSYEVEPSKQLELVECWKTFLTGVGLVCGPVVKSVIIPARI